MKYTTKDLREKLGKANGAHTIEQTVYVSGRYVGFASGSIGLGISFLRIEKGQAVRSPNGTVRWYFSGSNTLSEAAATARKRYSIKIPVKGWKKIRLKVYNTTTAEEIATFL